MGKLFGTNGVRGLVGSTMTAELALRLGRAVGTWLRPGDRIALGSDARASRDMLKAAFAAGVHSTGVHTVDVGVLASPGIQLFVRDRKLAAGAIVTASHNPPEYNGIKLVAPDGTETSPDEEMAVENLYASQKFRVATWDKVGTHSVAGDAADHYIAAVLAQVDAAAIRRKKFTVVVDPGGGAGCVTAPRLLRELGCKVVEVSCVLDGAFRDRPSEPTAGNATRAIAAVKSSKADLGVLQDGDADRAIFIDEKGGYVWGDTSLALAALYELPRHARGSIVCTAVSSSSCVADAVKKAGGRLEWTVVGSPIVAREMIRLGAVFGGEDNGGLMFRRHQVCRDGLMAMAFMLELLARTGKTMSQLCAQIPRYALVKDKVRVEPRERDALVKRLRTSAAKRAGVVSVDGRDGVKVYVRDGWVLIRPSGTEPIFRVQAEAKDDATARRLVEDWKAVLAGLRKKK